MYTQVHSISHNLGQNGHVCKVILWLKCINIIITIVGNVYELVKYVPVRSHVYHLGNCEHTDTILAGFMRVYI